MPQEGDAKTIAQRLWTYIEPVDAAWLDRIRPADKTQIEELKQRLHLNEKGLELPETYVEFLCEPQ